MLAMLLSSRLNGPAILTQPHSAAFKTALLLDAGGIESAINFGGELAVTEECGDTGTLRFRTAKAEFPLIAAAISDFLLAARLRVGERNIVSLDLLWSQARPDPLTPHRDALLLQLRALRRGHLALQLTKDQLQIRQILVIDFHVTGGQFPQTRLQHLRLSGHRKC
ncbi:hypothetical protein EMIT0P253_50157 [Pseudomonas sp. IT-P253]